MTIIVKDKDKIYFIGDYQNSFLEIKKNQENKFLLMYKDRVEPIAVYKNLENIQYVMQQIVYAVYYEKRIIYFPPRDNEFKKEEIESA